MTTRPRISPQVPQSCTGRPSVPLSVYRELVKELQATQVRVAFLEAQNQQLVKSNRQLPAILILRFHDIKSLITRGLYNS